MKTRQIMMTLAVAMLLGAGAYVAYRLGVNAGMQATTHQPENAAPASDKKVLYWHDPMVPGPRFDKPGKSPFMDMQLVPVYADEAGADDGKVAISPRVQQNLGVRIAEVASGPLGARIEAVGSVAYNERDVALVQARSNGFVERLLVRAPLDPVRKGQPLAELYVPDWVAAQEEYLAVKRMQGAGADGLLEAARQRMRLAGMSENHIRLVDATGKTHARLMLNAPLAGVVTELAAREGMTVMAGAPLFRINGTGTIWVNAELPENLAAQARPGQAVEARSAALPGTVFHGKLGAILPAVDPATRTLKARIELANPKGELVPGMFVSVAFAPAVGREALLIPSEAVIHTGKRSVVILAQGEGAFIPVDVETGSEANGQTEIRKGLDKGQKIVVSGQFLIDSEASLKGSAHRMGDPVAPQPAAQALHRGEAKVEHIGKEQITLSHGPIPSLQWGPMTMDFTLPAGGLPDNIGVGDSVGFEFRRNAQGVFEITSIAPRKSGASGGQQRETSK